MSVLALPTIHAQRRWLDREALRLKAGVTGADIEKVIGSIFRGRVAQGVPPEIATKDAEDARAYVLWRIEQLDELLSLGPWPGWRRVNG